MNKQEEAISIKEDFMSGGIAQVYYEKIQPVKVLFDLVKDKLQDFEEGMYALHDFDDQRQKQMCRKQFERAAEILRKVAPNLPEKEVDILASHIVLGFKLREQEGL